MTFSEALKLLNQGFVLRRECYGSEFVIFKQIPADILKEGISNMKSIPDQMKSLLQTNKLGISYKDQFIIYDLIDETATYMSFDGEDICANDWEVVNPYNYDIRSL